MRQSALSWEQPREGGKMRALVLMLGLAPLLALAGEPDPDPFDYFIGSWNCAGHFVSNGTPIASTIQAEWDERTQTLTIHHDDLAPHAYHAVETWGATRKPGRYHASIADRFSGVRWFSSEGWMDGTLMWSRLDEGREIERFVYIKKSDKAMSVNWLVARGAATELTLGDTLDCTKA
jgi:hypothetical protein